MSDVLQDFLNLGLLDIDGDDSRLEKLRSAASELAAQMKESPRTAIYHTLVVSADDPSPTDASFADVAQHVEKHWNTYRNRFPEVPRQLFKAVSLQALSIVGGHEDNSAKFAMGYIRRSIPAHADDVRERATIRRVLDKFDSDLEVHASKTWGVRSGGGNPISGAGAPKVTKIDREKLASSIVAASGPNNIQGQAIPGANPHWPANNQAWTNDFGNRLAETVAAAIEAGLSQVAGEVGKLGKSINEGVNATVVEARRQYSGVEKQNSLLWWRKTLYSSKLGESYRDLEPAEAVLMMTLDLQDLLGGIAPISAEHLLKEAVKDVCAATAEISVSDLAKAAQTTLKPILMEHVGLSTERAGLQPVVECLVRVASGTALDITKSSVLISSKFDPPSLACRLLQEMQALDLTPSRQNKQLENK